MKTYSVRYEPQEQQLVLNILDESNDIIIDSYGTTFAEFTIQHNDSDAFYAKLMADIDQRLNRKSSL